MHTSAEHISLFYRSQHFDFKCRLGCNPVENTLAYYTELLPYLVSISPTLTKFGWKCLSVPNTLAYFSLTSNVRLSKNLVTNALAYYAKA